MENLEQRKILEIEAPTVAEAIKQAQKQYNASKQKMQITILSEGKKGLFGMDGAAMAKIQVMPS